VALDVLGGPATLLLALLAERGEQIFHLPGLAINRAREAYRGGEHKSDRSDAVSDRRPAEDEVALAPGDLPQKRGISFRCVP
jgi:hypothetical protein